MTDNRTEAEKANDEALALQAKAIEAQQKANEPEKTADQKKADALAAKADDARAKAAELGGRSGSTIDTTVADAKVALHIGADPAMPAGSYDAVKRGNDPSNPKYAPGISMEPEDQTVRLSRVTKDSVEPIYTWVHPDMVGDYVRAGWRVD